LIIVDIFFEPQNYVIFNTHTHLIEKNISVVLIEKKYEI